jgi:plastocyanin
VRGLRAERQFVSQEERKLWHSTITIASASVVVTHSTGVVSLDGAFRSPALDTEDKFSFTFDKAGTFEYFCSLHPYMKAKVVVAP